MQYLRALGLASALCLFGCSSDQHIIGNQNEGFPLDFGAMQDFKISFPVKIISKAQDIDLETRMHLELKSLSPNACAGLDGCSFVKNAASTIDEAGNFITGSYPGHHYVTTVYFRSDGSIIRTADNQGVTCEYPTPSSVRGEIGSVYPIDEGMCTDGSSYTGQINVFKYNEDFAEVTHDLNDGQYKMTMLVDRKGSVEGIAIFSMETGVTFYGSSYDVQNPSAN